MIKFTNEIALITAVSDLKMFLEIVKGTTFEQLSKCSLSEGEKSPSGPINIIFNSSSLIFSCFKLSFELISANKQFSSLSSQVLNTPLDELLKISLRLRPERIFVGEIRGSEANTFISALNTGHRGCMATIHANSALDGIKRLSLLLKLDGKFLGQD